MAARVFSVMQKRDDLPEMTLPLALLLIIASSAFSCAGARLLSSAVNEGYLPALAASLAFLPAATCMYSLIILLWRRFASLLVTPVSLCLMLCFGVKTFSAVAFSVTVLLSAYTFAVSMISRETKFRRMTSLSVAVSVCLLLSLAGYIGVYFGTFADFTGCIMSYLTSLISEMYIALGGAKTYELCSSEAREIAVMLPAYIGITAILLSAATDVIAKAAFRVLDCENVFIELTKKITMPKTYAAVYFTVFLLFIFTSGAGNPLIYTFLKSVTYVMILPCAIVGVSSVVYKSEDEYFYMNNRRLASFLLIFLVVMMLGFKPSIVLASACGAIKVIAQHRDKNNSIQNI